jgi:hypothetical protein
MATGYEQVRSVAAHLAGDHAAAATVHLVLPETGMCSTSFAGVNATDEACCNDDALAKAAGEAGCGCTTAAAPPRAAQNSSGCGSPAHEGRATASETSDPHFSQR